MDIKLINIGFGNVVSANRIVAIVSPESAPIKRIISEARERGMLIDATYGRRTRAVIIADSDHVILSAVQPETVANRLAVKDRVPLEIYLDTSQQQSGGKPASPLRKDSGGFPGSLPVPVIPAQYVEV
jgi:regulator of extracellular matrix RemA (YlzA/DUF370 family)